MSLEKEIFPNSDKLVTSKGGTISVQIIDVELDPIDCVFNNDGAIQIKTEGLTYIQLSIENLERMIELIHEADDKYKSFYSEK